MSSSDLVDALIKDDSLTSELDRLDLWGKFDSSDWSNLLKSQPQFADKCIEYKDWEEFHSWNWRNLLSYQPQFSDKCKKWHWFKPLDWVNLLIRNLNLKTGAKHGNCLNRQIG